MLLEFSCANHKSIRDEVEFSTVAGKSDRHPGHLMTVGQLRVLRTAVLYGPNGSGKSNLLDAMATLGDRMRGLRPDYTPHKLAEGEPSRYAVQFLVDDVRYAYGLSVDGEGVLDEYLYTFPGGRRVCRFTRTREGIVSRHAPALTGPLDPTLPLPAQSGAETDPILAATRTFFTETLVPYRLDEETDNRARLEDAIDLLAQSEGTRAAVCTLLTLLDTGIREVRVQDGVASCVYADFTTDLRTEESTGIRRLIAFLCPLVAMLREGKILLCDEPEAHLHESVLRALLDTLRRAQSASRAQLIFATHSTALLDLDLFRRDQIWFTERRPEDRSTDLYSLCEIRDIRADENIRLGYLNGKYGAMPDFDDLARLFGEEVRTHG